jgi:hypothetical protein
LRVKSFLKKSLRVLSTAHDPRNEALERTDQLRQVTAHAVNERWSIRVAPWGHIAEHFERGYWHGLRRWCSRVCKRTGAFALECVRCGVKFIQQALQKLFPRHRAKTCLLAGRVSLLPSLMDGTRALSLKPLRTKGTLLQPPAAGLAFATPIFNSYASAPLKSFVSTLQLPPHPLTPFSKSYQPSLVNASTPPSKRSL